MQIACRNFLDGKQNVLDEHPKILNKLDGWNRILWDQCNYNNLTDVLPINQPRQLAELTEQADFRSFCFASHVNPGMHSFLIYSPKNHEAYCQHLLVDLNTADMYPQNQQESAAGPAKAANMWHTRQEVERKPDHLQEACNFDMSQKTFELRTFIKESQDNGNQLTDAKKCESFIESYYELLADNYQQHLGKSPEYPRMDWTTFNLMIDTLQKNYRR